LSDFPDFLRLCLEFKDKYVTCPHIVYLLIDAYEGQNTNESLKQAIELCDQLENSLDSLHKKYHNFRKQTLQTKLTKIF